jgi:hypothetical protein
MTTAACGKTGRKHTPITSERERRFFGAELGRKKKGLKTRTRMSGKILMQHLEETKGKKLPEKA